jgi:C-methyltransferase C-terminal domain
VQLKGGKRPVKDSVREILKLEADRKLDKVATLKEFGQKVDRLRAQTSKLASDWKESGVKVAGYGAARSGPTLIAQLGLSGAIDYIVDDHPQKVDRYSSGEGIPILPTAELLKRMPDYTVILAWVHAQKIIDTNRAYLEKGGRFVVLCPQTRVVGSRGEEKVLS